MPLDIVRSINFQQTLLVADNVGNQFDDIIRNYEVVLDEQVEQELVVPQDLLQLSPANDLAPLQVGETDEEPDEAELEGDSEEGLENDLDQRGDQQEGEYEVEDQIHFLVEEVVVQRAHTRDVLLLSCRANKFGKITSCGHWKQ